MSNTVSIFDVKEKYDAAYDEQAKPFVNLERFAALMAEALRLDDLYRAQLATSPAFSYVRAAA